MTNDKIKESIIKIARNVFKSQELELNEESNATNVENWTSLTFMLLLSEIEKEFGIKFKMTDLLTINSIGDIISVIRSKTDNE